MSLPLDPIEIRISGTRWCGYFFASSTEYFAAVLWSGHTPLLLASASQKCMQAYAWAQRGYALTGTVISPRRWVTELMNIHIALASRGWQGARAMIWREKRWAGRDRRQTSRMCVMPVGLCERYGVYMLCVNWKNECGNLFTMWIAYARYQYNFDGLFVGCIYICDNTHSTVTLVRFIYVLISDVRLN